MFQRRKLFCFKLQLLGTYVPDDWADKVSENGSSADDAGGGGSESGESMDTDSGEGNAEASASAKRKRAAQQQPSVKKTHLNIVFIGHVGM